MNKTHIVFSSYRNWTSSFPNSFLWSGARRRNKRALRVPSCCCLKFRLVCRQVISSFFQPVQVCNFISLHAEVNIIIRTAPCKLSVQADNTLCLTAASARL